MAFCGEDEELLELGYEPKFRPQREARVAPQRYSPRFEKRRAPAQTRGGIQRRGTRGKPPGFLA